MIDRSARENAANRRLKGPVAGKIEAISRAARKGIAARIEPLSESFELDFIQAGLNIGGKAALGERSVEACGRRFKIEVLRRTNDALRRSLRFRPNIPGQYAKVPI